MAAFLPSTRAHPPDQLARSRQWVDSPALMEIGFAPPLLLLDSSRENHQARNYPSTRKMAGSIESSALDALRRRLVSATVHVPGSESYKKSIVRWSDTGMRHAVCEPIHVRSE